MAYFTEKQLDDFRELLIAARDAAKAVLEQRTGNLQVEAAGQTIGRLTRMDALQLQAMSAMSRDQIRVRLRQIEAALQVWDAGTYGVCRQCQRPVSLQRLEALPEAPFCMDCQESLET